MPTYQPPTSTHDLTVSIEDQILEALLCAHLPTPSSSQSSSSSNSKSSSSSPASSSSPTSDIRHPPSDISPVSLAHRFNLSLSLILDFLALPSTRSRLAAAIEAGDILHHQHSQRARTKALSALENILDTSADPVEHRRAATAILRPSRAVSPSSIRAHRDPPPERERTIRPAPLTPSVDRDAQQTVLEILERLSDDDNPTPAAGLTSLHNHLDRAAGFPADLDSFIDDPGDAAELFSASNIIIHPPTIDEATNTHHQPATLTWPDFDPVHAHFTLRPRPSYNPPGTTWHITDLTIEDADDTDDEDPEDTSDESTDDRAEEDTNTNTSNTNSPPNSKSDSKSESDFDDDDNDNDDDDDNDNDKDEDDDEAIEDADDLELETEPDDTDKLELELNNLQLAHPDLAHLPQHAPTPPHPSTLDPQPLAGAPSHRGIYA